MLGFMFLGRVFPDCAVIPGLHQDCMGIAVRIGCVAL